MSVFAVLMPSIQPRKNLELHLDLFRHCFNNEVRIFRRAFENVVEYKPIQRANDGVTVDLSEINTFLQFLANPFTRLLKQLFG